MAAMQRTNRLPIEHDMRAIRPRTPRRGPPLDDMPGRGLVIVAHLALLLSVGALVIGLTLGSIALARRCIGTDAAPGLAAKARENGGGSRTGTTGTGAWSTR